MPLQEYIEWLLVNICKLKIYNTNIEFIKSETRKRPAPEIRAMIFSIIKNKFKNRYSYSQISEYFKKDHATVIYNINVIHENLYSTEIEYKEAYNEINEKFNNLFKTPEEVFIHPQEFDKDLWGTVFLGINA